MLSALLADVRYAFSRRNLIQNSIFAAMTLVAAPLLHAYAGLSWPYLISVGLGVFILAVIVASKIRSSSSRAEAPPQPQPRSRTFDLGRGFKTKLEDVESTADEFMRAGDEGEFEGRGVRHKPGEQGEDD